MLYPSKLWCLLIFVYKDFKCMNFVIWGDFRPGSKTFPFNKQSMDCLLSIFYAFSYNRNLFVMRETLFGEWTHDLLPLCDVQTCSGLGLSNNFLRYMTAFGTDSAGKTSIASWHKISVFSFHVHTVMSLQDSVCLSERLQQKNKDYCMDLH